MSGGRTAGYALLALAGVLLVLAIMSAWSGTQRFASREDNTRSVQDAAAAFVVAYGTFDHREPEAYTSRLVALTADPLRGALDEASVDPDAARVERAITTRIETVTVTALSDGEATVAVTAVQERRWADPVLGLVLQDSVRQRVSCRLLEEGGRWLVAELRLQSEEPARADAR